MSIFGRLFGGAKSAPAAGFQEEVRAAFRFLVEEFQFAEETAAPGVFALAFASARTRVVVEGTEYGTNARVALGGTRGRFEDYDLGFLLRWRRPDLLSSVEAGDPPATQAEIVRRYAPVLREVAADVLRGDHTVFADLAAEVERRRLAYEEHMRRTPDQPWPRS